MKKKADFRITKIHFVVSQFSVDALAHSLPLRAAPFPTTYNRLSADAAG
jgi:hypothetical protein